MNEPTAIEVNARAVEDAAKEEPVREYIVTVIYRIDAVDEQDACDRVLDDNHDVEVGEAEQA